MIASSSSSSCTCSCSCSCSKDRASLRKGALDPVSLSTSTCTWTCTCTCLPEEAVRGGAPVCYEPCVQPEIHSTTILSVRRGNHVVVAGDGQVTLGNTVVKGGAKKVRRLGVSADGCRAIGGFAGSAADGIALFERLDEKLQAQRSPLRRAAVELAKEWRTDRALRRLEAMLVVADAESTFILSGSGDVIEPDDGICAIGSGGSYALAAARALLRHTELGPRAIAESAMAIAADICIYTNTTLTIEELP